MLVYGDRSRSEEPAHLLETIRTLIVEGRTAEPQAKRHDGLVAALIEAGMLAQGIADAEMQAANGLDTASPPQAAAMTLVTALARAVHGSWKGEPIDEAEIASALSDLASQTLPARVDVKQPEGYAYYALYPEAYAIAAQGLPAGTQVIGLRSIGTSLAAMVVAGASSDSIPVSLRPVGPPFQRHYAIEEATWQRLAGCRAPCHALVDEGPGLSGSSLGALADRLEDAGVEPDRIVVFPGHGGDLGPRSAARHRTRWGRIERRLATFDTVILPRLAPAVQDLTGPALAPPRDLSGGEWREIAIGREADWPPVNAMQERRKFLLQADNGLFLLKFVGLGGFGHAALSDAQAMHVAGFGPEPLGLGLGFMVSRWEHRCVDRTPPMQRVDCLSRLGAYIAFRTTLPPDEASRADLASLAEMTAHNLAEGLGPREAEAWHQRYGDVARLRGPRPVNTDSRMHIWEWFTTAEGVWLKADGTDHCRSHDLVGCQDITWDIAGAQVEFDLSQAELEGLVAVVEQGSTIPIDLRLLDWTIPVYLAFQLGSWSMAASTSIGTDRQRIEGLLDRYRARLRAILLPDA